MHVKLLVDFLVQIDMHIVQITYKFCKYLMHVKLLVDFLVQIDMHIVQIDWFLIVCLLVFLFQVDMHLAS
jgi:hypothetical protein